MGKSLRRPGRLRADREENRLGNTEMICQYCGQQIDDNAEFCSFCGRKVIHVPPVFTMAGLKTGIATEVVRSYTEWGFYNNPDADLDPETGKKPDYGYDALEALPDENHLKWASDFMKAEQMEAALAAEAAVKVEKAKAAEVEAEPEEAEPDTEPDTEPDEDAASYPPDAKPKKRLPCAVIVIALVLLAGAVAGGAYYLFGGDKTYEVDLNALMVQPKIIGYNDYGEMALMPQIDSAKEDEWLRTVEFDVDKENFRKVLDTVTYTPDKTKELSNGDTVTITIDYDQALAEENELIVHADTATFEVKGLEIGKDLAYDPNAYHAYYDDFILPESDRTKLSREDVAYSTNGSIATTQQAINEIYARHGYIFTDKKYDKLFRGFKWYTPMYKQEEFDGDWLNKNEKANLGLLIEYRDALKAAEAKAAEEAAAKEEAEKAEKEKTTTEAQDGAEKKSSDQ